MKATRKVSTRSRHQRVRRKVQGTPERPRLAVFRSNQHIYAQIIDDAQQHTLVAASTLEAAVKRNSAPEPPVPPPAMWASSWRNGPWRKGFAPLYSIVEVTSSMAASRPLPRLLAALV